ncbi:CCGSCS motif protein [Marinobacter sp. ANT_B65]|nr:CCGSCS motif protein [Marinobacter sp. ANT_B65]
MVQLFKEVGSPKNAEKAETESPEDSAMEKKAEALSGIEKETKKKNAHGSSGVCCGGCS